MSASLKPKRTLFVAITCLSWSLAINWSYFHHVPFSRLSGHFLIFLLFCDEPCCSLFQENSLMLCHVFVGSVADGCVFVRSDYWEHTNSTLVRLLLLVTFLHLRPCLRLCSLLLQVLSPGLTAGHQSLLLGVVLLWAYSFGAWGHRFFCENISYIYINMTYPLRSDQPGSWFYT